MQIAFSVTKGKVPIGFLDFLITGQYSRMIPENEENKIIRKVLINLYDDPNEGKVDFFNDRGNEPPLVIFKYGMSFKKYEIGSIKEKCAMQLASIDACIELLCNIYKWDYSVYDSIKRKMYFDNFDFIWGVKKPIISKNRDFKIQIICKPKYSSADYYLKIEEKVASDYISVKDFLVFKGGPGDELWPSFFGKQRWINDREYVLESRFGEISFKVNVVELSCSLEISEDKDQQDHILMLMGMWFYSKERKDFNDFFLPLNPEIQKYEIKKFTEPIWIEGNR